VGRSEESRPPDEASIRIEKIAVKEHSNGGEKHMKVRLTVPVLVTFALMNVIFTVNADPFVCQVAASVPPLTRAEGHADLAGDVVLTCTGGTPTPAGAPVPLATFTIFTTTDTSSRLLAPEWSEALLIVDEPGSPLRPGTPQLPCGAAGTTEVSRGVCGATGTGDGTGTYSGTGGRANVFQGVHAGRNATKWTIPLDPRGASVSSVGPGTRILRFTNIRVADSLLGMPVMPLPIFGLVGVIGDHAPAIENPMQIVAYSERGLNFLIKGPGVHSSCDPQNPALLKDPNSASGVQSFAVRFAEGFANAWKTRTIAAFIDDHTSPPPAAQNVPGASHLDSETGFYNPAYPTIAGRGDLSRAGLADQGTRLQVHFTHIPDGVSLFIDTVGHMVRQSDETATVGVVRLVSVAPDGSGPFLPLFGSGAGIQQIPISAGHTAQAVFEVLAQDPLSAERVDITVYVAYNSTHVATIMAAGSFAPFGADFHASTDDPVPRFIRPEGSETAFTITACK
jgi:hypothetical protein